MAMLLFAVLLLLASVTAAMIAASPLFRTLSIALDSWAEESRWEEREPLR